MLKQRGVTLIELMIALTISMVMVLAGFSLYISQMKTFMQYSRKDQTTQEGVAAFETISDLMMQAEMCLFSCAAVQTVNLSYPAGVTNPNPQNTLQLTNDSLQIDFTVPSGFPVWPNVTAPYTNNAIRVNWDGVSGLVTVSAGASISDVATLRTPIIIAGGTGKMNYQIINLDVWPMLNNAGVLSAGATATDKPTGGYRITMTAKVGTPDINYSNPKDPTGPLAHYRTLTYERIVIPRNW